jgi:hypothetical protein
VKKREAKELDEEAKELDEEAKQAKEEAKEEKRAFEAAHFPRVTSRACWRS